MYMVIKQVPVHVHNVYIFVDPDRNPNHLCLLSYHMPSDFTPIIASHWNSKVKKPFFPTLPCTKMEMEMQSRSCGPKATLSIVSEKLGVVNADGPCELPRNERQIFYIKSKSTSANHPLVAISNQNWNHTNARHSGGSDNFFKSKDSYWCKFGAHSSFQTQDMT